MARLAKSLETLRNQVDAKFPKRSKASDGWIGDAAHQAKGGASASQHNPNDADVVCAIDITEDLSVGLDCNRLMAELDASNDSRIFYLIHDRKIDNSNDVTTAYNGANPHDKHLHISVRYTVPALYDDARPWQLPMLSASVAPVAPQAPRPVTGRPTIRLGSTGPHVAALQSMLGQRFPAYRHEHGVLVVDGDFGPTTQAWVKEFQSRSGLTADGVVGPKTWAKLG